MYIYIYEHSYTSVYTDLDFRGGIYYPKRNLHVCIPKRELNRMYYSLNITRQRQIYARMKRIQRVVRHNDGTRVLKKRNTIDYGFHKVLVEHTFSFLTYTKQ